MLRLDWWTFLLMVEFYVETSLDARAVVSSSDHLFFGGSGVWLLRAELSGVRIVDGIRASLFYLFSGGVGSFSGG